VLVDDVEFFPRALAKYPFLENNWRHPKIGQNENIPTPSFLAQYFRPTTQTQLTTTLTKRYEQTKSRQGIFLFDSRYLSHTLFPVPFLWLIAVLFINPWPGAHPTNIPHTSSTPQMHAPLPPTKFGGALRPRPLSIHPVSC
jgi:hypothetical protein